MRIEDSGESAAAMRRRAAELRSCAARAQQLVGPLGSYLESAVMTATSRGLWQGPYAEQVIDELGSDRSMLHYLAAELSSSVRVWLAVADQFERDAADQDLVRSMAGLDTSRVPG